MQYAFHYDKLCYCCARNVNSPWPKKKGVAENKTCSPITGIIWNKKKQSKTKLRWWWKNITHQNKLRWLSRNTNKMQLCNRIYYSKVFWRLNMFQAAYRSSSGVLNCICSLWFIYARGDWSLSRFSGNWNNKFYYKAASCWYFYWVVYDARIHEYQTEVIMGTK